MKLDAKPIRRKKAWSLTISEADLRMKIRRRTGEKSKGMPKKGKESRSTKICIWDICLLARAGERAMTGFLAGAPRTKGYSTLGQKKLSVVNEIIDKVNGGYITKSQYGVYHFHDKPVVAPVRNMQVNLATGLIGKEIISPPKHEKMPNFQNLFGSK
jgi:hypothetical protein